MDKAWEQIVAEALAAGLNTSKGPVPGAKLRELVARSAQSRNLKYPPDGYEQESFGDFLKHFDSIVLVRRRKGKDLLSAPADKPELLAESAGKRRNSAQRRYLRSFYSHSAGCATFGTVVCTL